MIALLLTLLTQLTWAETLTIDTLSRTERKLVEQISTKIAPFAQAINTQSTKKNGYQLARADLDAGLSLEAGLLVFSKSFERSIELVWERNEAKQSTSEMIEIALNGDENELAATMMTSIQHRLGERWSNTRVREKIIRTIYKDARKINRYILSIAHFNASGKSDWIVANYFKNYYFSVAGDLLLTGASYDSRLRFRFRVPSVLEPKAPSTRYEKRVARRLHRLSQHFAEVQAMDMPYHRFTMNRVRFLSDLELGLDFGAFEVSKGRGLLLEWTPRKRETFDKGLIPGMTPESLRRLASLFEEQINDYGVMELSQIRLKGALEANMELGFFSISKARDVEYHYRRRQL